jgi:hypothetical protein
MRGYARLFLVAIVAAQVVLTPFDSLPFDRLSAAPAAAAPALQPAAGQFVPVDPVALVSSVVVGANETVQVAAAGHGPVPAGAIAVTVNVTASATADGWLAVHPGGTAAPATRAVTYRAGLTARVGATVGLDAGGRLAITNGGPASATVTLDVQGYADGGAGQAGSVYVPLTPSRVLSNASVAAGASRTFTATGAGGVPSTGVSAVALTLSAQSSAAGRATAYRSGGSDPGTPHVEYVPGAAASNFVVVRPGTDGKVVLTNGGTAAATMSVDVAGYYITTDTTTPGSRLVPVAPQRLRTALSVGARTYVAVQVSGQGGVPSAGVNGACVHLTVVGPPTVSSALLAYPSNVTLAPSVATVRYYAGLTSTGSAAVRVPSDGRVRIYNFGTEAVTVDVDLSCYYAAASRPASPTRAAAQAADRAATVSWQAPPDGGATITSYEVTSSPDGRTATVPGDMTSAAVTGLTNGVTYRFSVKARNAAGVSDASALSNGVTPQAPQPPQAPFVTSVYPRDRAVRVTWSPPPDGADSVVSYRVTASPGGSTVEVDGQDTEAIVGGLANGTAYTFVVTASNGAGAGDASPPSEPVVPSPADPPLAPSALLAVPLDRRIDVQWVAPPDGGAAISGYRVTAEPGDHAVDVPADTTVAALTGLTNGTTYTVRVVARNSAGAGPATERAGLVPAAARPPAAPNDLRVGIRGSGTVMVQWTPPVDSGTSAITGYTVTAEPGGTSVSTTGTTAEISGLDPTQGYRFQVAARNAAGTGPASQQSRAVTPALSVRAAPKVFTASESATLRLVRTDGTLVFEQPPASVSAVAAGTVVVLSPHPSAPAGLFRKVTGVSTQGGLVTITTGPAALTEVFDDASLAAVSEVGNAEVAAFLAESPAIRRKEATLKGRTLGQGAPRAATPGISIGLRDGHVVAEVTLSINTEQPDDPLRQPTKVPPLGGRLEAQLDIDPRLDNTIDISGSGVDTFHHLSVNYITQLRAKFGLQRAEEFTLPGAKIKARCFNIQAGPVPIVICLEFNLTPTITVDGSVGISAGVTFGRIIGGEMSTHNGLVTSHRGIDQSTGVQGSSLEAYADGDIIFALPFESTVYFYNVAGPGLVIRPYVQLKLDTTQNPWWEIRVGVRLGIFFRSREFFGYQIDFANDNVVNIFFTILNSGGPFAGLKITPSDAEVVPGQAVTFHAESILYPPDIPIQWRMVAGPGQIDSTGTYRSPLAGNAVIEAYSPAEPGRPELVQRANVRVRGTTIPSPPRNVTAGARALAAQVSWVPPATDGNLPINEYVIVSTPPSRTVRVSGDQTTARVTALRPGVEYTFQVFAVNDKGTSDPSLPSSPVTPYEALRITGPLVNVAVDADGVPDTTGLAGKSGAFISGNGRYVFFEVPDHSNLAPPEVYDPNTSNGYGMYLVRKDRFTGEIVLAARGTDGTTPTQIWFASGGTNARSDVNAVANYDGTAVAYYIGSELLVHHLTTRSTTNVTAGALRASGQMGLSRDGGTVVFKAVNADDKQHIYVSAGGLPPRQIDRCHFSAADCEIAAPYRFFEFVFAFDAGVVYYTEEDRAKDQTHLFRHDTTTGSEADLSAPPASGPEDVHNIATSADGRTVVADFRTWSGSGTLYGMIIKTVGAGAAIGPADIVLRPGLRDGYYVNWLSPTDVAENGQAVAYQYYDGTSLQAYVYDVEQATVIPLQNSGTVGANYLDLATNATAAVWTRCAHGPSSCLPQPGVWVQSLA